MKSNRQKYGRYPPWVTQPFDRFIHDEWARLNPPLWRPWDPPEGPPDWVLFARSNCYRTPLDPIEPMPPRVLRRIYEMTREDPSDGD